MVEMLLRIHTILPSQDGQDLVEYALLCGLIALVCVAAMSIAGRSISTLWAPIVTGIIEVALEVVGP